MKHFEMNNVKNGFLRIESSDARVGMDTLESLL